MASAVLKSAYCVKLRKPRCCCAFRSSRQLKVVPIRRSATMTVRGTVSTFGIFEALPILRKEGKVVVTQSSSTTALFPRFKQILKFAAEKVKSIIGIHGQHRPRKYDIFISYNRDDTLHPVSHLKGALERRGMRTVVDYTLDRGEEIWPAIIEAIKQSNIAVVVVSQNYHFSPWCLNELVKILECKKRGGLIVFPIFWGIDARELREQSSTFVENIGQGEEGFKQENPHQVQRWRKALQAVGRINGFPVNVSLDKTEAEVIEALADEIEGKLNRSVSNVTSHPACS
ncbi:hypothetical protein ACJRO7_027367 [Eucalyptus globulus]|uniref:TIR domain-containing protein n=1 Tax=Eucalyptus globulus TaxID=34317 RepID=A0ABD3K194_EUCGL